jgi:predicted anti-sigma-YlaC factor YlaD
MADGHVVGHAEVTCREFVELVTDYWENALPPVQVGLIEEHLVMCDWCKTYLDQMERTVQAMGSPPGEPVPEPTREALMSAFREWKGG